MSDKMPIKTAFFRAFEWRLVAIGIDFVVVFAMTGKPVLSLGITSVSNGIRTIVHAFWIQRRGHD